MWLGNRLEFGPYSATLSFLEEGKKYVAEIYADAPETHWETNPLSIAIHQQIVACVRFFYSNRLNKGYLLKYFIKAPRKIYI